jgi:hypothetical protein
MKQLLGDHKTEFIRQSTGVKYTHGYTSAKYGHFVAEMWIDERNADYVNYRKPRRRVYGVVKIAAIRDGERVGTLTQLLYKVWIKEAIEDTNNELRHSNQAN